MTASTCVSGLNYPSVLCVKKFSLIYDFSVFSFLPRVRPHSSFLPRERPRQLLCWRRPRRFSTSDFCFISKHWCFFCVCFFDQVGLRSVFWQDYNLSANRPRPLSFRFLFQHACYIFFGRAPACVQQREFRLWHGFFVLAVKNHVPESHFKSQFCRACRAGRQSFFGFRRCASFS